MRPLLPQPRHPSYRLVRLGQGRQGVFRFYSPSIPSRNDVIYIFATSEASADETTFSTKISDLFYHLERVCVAESSKAHDQVWELSKCKLKTNHYGHTGYINTLAVSPDGSLAASGGKDGITMLWDLNEGKHLYSLEAGDVVNSLVFSPNRYWLCAATASSIKIFDLESK